MDGLIREDLGEEEALEGGALQAGWDALGSPEAKHLAGPACPQLRPDLRRVWSARLALGRPPEMPSVSHARLRFLHLLVLMAPVPASPEFISLT